MSSPHLDVRIDTHFNYETMTYDVTRYIMRDGEVVGRLENDGPIKLAPSQYRIEEIENDSDSYN